MNSIQIPTIVIFGKNRSGKSALAKMILYEEESETRKTKTMKMRWRVRPGSKNPYLNIYVVNTSGLTDIRDPEIILKDILEFLRKLKGGFNIAIYCLSLTQEFYRNDQYKLQVMGTLLGNEVFSHTFIALTQIEGLKAYKREQTIKRFFEEISPALKNTVFLNGFNDKILIADFNNFDPFLRSLDKLLKACPSYYPKLVKLVDEVDTSNLASIKKFLKSPQIQQFLKEYEQMIENKCYGLLKFDKTIEDQVMTDEYKNQIQDRENQIQELQKIISELRSNLDYSELLFYQYQYRDPDMESSQNFSPKKDRRLRENRSDGQNIDGGKDHRFKEIRIKSFNMDGTRDRRYKENRSDDLNVDDKRDHRLKENRNKGFNMDGTRDRRYKENRSDDLNIDDNKDHRLKENRIKGFNVDGTRDRRYKENRSDDLNVDDKRDHRLKENRIKGFNVDGTLDRRYKENKLVPTASSKDYLSASNFIQNKSLVPVTSYSPTPSQNTTAPVPLKTNWPSDFQYSVNKQTSNFTVPDQTAHTIGPLKKDGTPDLRYSANKQASSFTGPNQSVHTTGPLKHDGTLDMRYSVNKQAVSSMISTQANTATGKATSGTSGHAGKTGGSHASAGGGKSSAGSCSASCGSGGKSGGGKPHK